MEKIKWMKSSDCFLIDRETLANLTDWADMIYRNHYDSYDEEDLLELKEELDIINQSLLKYLQEETRHKKIKICND